MEENISIEQINNYSKIYNSDKNNKIIENAITKNGLENACIDRDIIIENQPIFNIELPESKRYDQKDNHKCWIYAGINMIKHNIAKNLNIDVKELELSNSYIAFFDKLEKSNTTYENIINLENFDYDYINNQAILTYCVTEEGRWQWFKSIINKYGIVPYEIMPDAVESLNYEKIDKLYAEKVKKDVMYLLEEKRNNNNLEKLRNMKGKFLEENYIFLSKLLGEPKLKFDYEYKDKNDNYLKINHISSIDFKNKFLDINLNDFISIANIPMYNKEYYKVYRKKYLGSVYKDSYAEFLNLPIKELKELVIYQLKDNIPVFMTVNLMKFRDKKSGVLDKRLYNYVNTLKLKTLTKEEALNIHHMYPHHAMVFTGVNLIDNNPQRWKLEDSYGTSEKINGYYIMNDNYFEDFVFSIIINKRYLSEKQLKALEQEVVKIDVEEPF